MIPIQYLDATPELTSDVSTGTWAKLSWHEQFTTPARPGAQPTPGTAFQMYPGEEVETPCILDGHSRCLRNKVSPLWFSDEG